MGLSPAGDPGSIVRTSSKSNFKPSLPGKLAEYSWSGSETKPASEIPNFVESLKILISGFKSQSKHYIIIDGLDDVLTIREVQYKSLSALIFEVRKLNSLFSNKGVPAKIIVLCRTDLFEKIPGANKNKIRQDYSTELDWYHDPRKPGTSLLVDLANLRAKRSFGHEVDIFSTFFPNAIDQTDTLRFLLDMTRHTPRDFISLLKNIQPFSNYGKLDVDQIKSGLREYSIKYFLPEIEDELSGYATPDEIEHITKALSRIRKRDFKYKELVDASKSLPKSISSERIYDITTALFNCSALGNIQNKPGGNTFYTFKYRNRHSAFNETEGIMLHRGLWKALNVT